jgi:ParB-like chromosome segregation protein Spo0J
MTHKTLIQIEQRHVASLKPYARILRKNDHAVDRMAKAIEAFGFKIPILIRGNGEVIDGELRLKAAKKLGMEEVPVIVCDEWSEAEVKAFRLLVNRSASWATFDLDLVASEIMELKGLDFDLSQTGFDGVELDGFLFT